MKITMKKIISSLFITLSTLLVFSAAPVCAKVITNENGTVTVAKNEVINDDLFVGASDVAIDGVINGDVFIGAETVKITGVVNGNLHVGASTVDLDGTVKGNVYSGAQNIFIRNSKINGSLIGGAATFSIDKDSIVGGSLIVGAGNISIDSQVKRSVYAGAGSLTIGNNTKITKDLYYGSSNEQNSVNISSNAKVLGNTYKHEVDTKKAKVDSETSKKQLASMFSGLKVVSTAMSFVGALIVGFIYSKFFQKNLLESSKLVSSSFWKSMGVGFLITISFVPAVIILLITVIGIPIAGLAVLMLMLYSYLTKIVVGFAVGIWISQKFKWNLSQYIVFVLGLFVIYLLKMIPVVGSLSGLVIFWVGLGALALQTFSKSE
jgi:hypothetical protein